MSEVARAYTSREHPVMQPRSASRYRFALTPLADAMFQLLIFFMLTSSLTPYSLLTIRSGPEAGTVASDPSAEPADEPALPGENAQFWTISQGEVTANGTRFPLDQLPALAAALGQNDQAEVILIMESSAQVQDLTSVLEALTSAGVTSVQIAETGGQP